MPSPYQQRFSHILHANLPVIRASTFFKLLRSKMSTSIGISTTKLIAGKTPSSLPLTHCLISSSSSVRVFTRFENRPVRLVTSATAAKTPDSVKREPRGITKPKRVSPEMQAFLGVQEIPRTLALKEIWAYIKQHELQDPQNKKIIICDAKLKTIFADKDRVGFLEIAGLISPHFLKS